MAKAAGAPFFMQTLDDIINELKSNDRVKPAEGTKYHEQRGGVANQAPSYQAQAMSYGAKYQPLPSNAGVPFYQYPLYQQYVFYMPQPYLYPDAQLQQQQMYGMLPGQQQYQQPPSNFHYFQEPYVGQPMLLQPYAGQIYVNQPLYQPQTGYGQQNQQKHFMSPEDASKIDISRVNLDQDKLFQIYIGNVPQDATEAQIKAMFEVLGEVKNVHLQNQYNYQNKQPYAFVNFKTREGAIAAFQQRNFTLNGKTLDLAGFHTQLTIILRRIPPKVKVEEFYQTLLDFFASKERPDLYSYVQFNSARFGVSAYLHFLSKEESIAAFALLSNLDFTVFTTQKLKLIAEMELVKYITNAEVDRRQQANEKPNQDLDHEVLQFLCVRFVSKPAGQNQQQQAPAFYQYQPNAYQYQPVAQPYQPVAQPYQQGLQQFRPAPPVNQQRFPQAQYGGFSGEKQPNSVYLKDLPFKIEKQAIQTAMSEFGQVNSVSLINSREQSGQRPSAIVYFAMTASAQNALSAGILMIGGCYVPITPHVKKNRY